MEANSENISEEKAAEIPSKKKPLKNILKSSVIFQCETCQKVFEKNTNLIRHVRTAHPGLYNCPECREQYAGPPDLLRHLRQEHHDVTTFHCLDCGESFMTKSELQCHRKTHKGRPSVYCEQCNQTFVYKKDLKIHVKEVHKAIPRLTNEQPVIMTNHIITNDGKSVVIFSCNLCDRAFNLKTDLLRHFLIHSGEKPFNCEICQAKFNRRSNLLRHRRSMHNVVNDTQVFRCRKSDLRQRRYHNREIWEIESEAIAEEERIIREQQLIDKQRRTDARLGGLMQEEVFIDNEDLAVEEDDIQNSDLSCILVEADDTPKSGVGLSLLQPDEQITVRILTFDN